MYPGATYLIPSGPNGHHLHVVATNQCQNQSLLLFSLTTIYEGKYFDPTCIFGGGEHEFITHKTYVYYKTPLQRFVSGIQKCVSGGSFIPKADVTPTVLDRIRAGIPLSDHSPQWAINHFHKYG